MRPDIDHLKALYMATDDPWDFRTSPYEAGKFVATVAALPRQRYAHALELGCGNGELARRVAPRCAAYTGLDAVEIPLAAARVAVPHGRFIQGYLPCPLPDGPYDLILLSEILYFLDRDAIAMLASQLDAKHPDADIVAVTWCGPSGNAIEGEAAVDLYADASARTRIPFERTHPDFRIDRFTPLVIPVGS